MLPTRVLLADDHALVRAGIRNALEEMDALEIVGEVGDGLELVQAINALLPDLLLIDVTMPNFEPIAAIRLVRQMHPEMRILVVSAYDDDVYVQGLLREGVHGYHLKDQPLADLRLAVGRVLAGKRWISSSLVDKLVQEKEIDPAAARLSGRQLELLTLLSRGLDNRAMAAHLGLSIKTIETHLTRLYRQLKVQSRLEAANFAHAHPDIAARAAHAASQPNLVLPEAQQTPILVVDDNQRYRQQLRRMVARIHPQAAIYEADNSEDAVHLARQIAPRIAFIDVVLGDESGIRCARELKRVAAQTRIILISAYPDREFHRMGLEMGASAFLDKKDIDAATLYQIITDAVD